MFGMNGMTVTMKHQPDVSLTKPDIACVAGETFRGLGSSLVRESALTLPIPMKDSDDIF